MSEYMERHAVARLIGAPPGYVGYEDGSFLEMDVIDRASPGFRSSLHVDEDAAYRVVVISRTGNAALKPVTVFLSENLIQVADAPGPVGYDPRQRPWSSNLTVVSRGRTRSAAGLSSQPISAISAGSATPRSRRTSSAARACSSLKA